MATEGRALPRDVVESVLAACRKSGRKTDEAEVRRALAALSSKELNALRRGSQQPLSAPTSPTRMVELLRKRSAASMAEEENGRASARINPSAEASGSKAPSASPGEAEDAPSRLGLSGLQESSEKGGGRPGSYGKSGRSDSTGRSDGTHSSVRIGRAGGTELSGSRDSSGSREASDSRESSRASGSADSADTSFSSDGSDSSSSPSGSSDSISSGSSSSGSSSSDSSSSDSSSSDSNSSDSNSSDSRSFDSSSSDSDSSDISGSFERPGGSDSPDDSAPVHPRLPVEGGRYDREKTMTIERQFSGRSSADPAPQFMNMSPEGGEAAGSGDETLKAAPRQEAARGKGRRKAESEEIQELLTLFAYHRDPVRVAQELSLNVAELQMRIDSLGLRRRISTIMERTTDIDLFQPQRFAPSGPAASPTPLVRRRREREDAAKEEADSSKQATEAQQAQSSAVEAPLDEDRGEEFAEASQNAQPAPEPDSRRSRKEAGRLAPRREYVRQLPKARRAQARKAKPVKKQPEVQVEPEVKKESISTLFHPMGKPVIEGFIEREKANVHLLVSKLSEDFVSADGGELNEKDLRELLEFHGMTESFREKEKANTRFLMGFHQGARAKLANALGLDINELEAHLELHELSEELEQIREERTRLELGKNRLRDRLMQVLTRAPYLDDLGVLQVIDREVEDLIRGFYQEQREAAEGNPELLDERVWEMTGLQKNQFAKLLRRYSMTDHAKKVLRIR